MRINIIAAIEKSRGIGIHNKLPFHFKKDLKYFSEKTTGDKYFEKNCVIMGKNTWNSLPYRPLKNRVNIVITSDQNIPNSFADIPEAIRFCKIVNFTNIWVIGGESIYKYFLDNNLATDLYITKIDGDYECDRFFPEISDNWKLETNVHDDENGVNLIFEKYSNYNESNSGES